MTLRPYLSHEHPIRFAHRGSRLLWPENTLIAFQGAVDLGYRYVETDVRATRDGILVLFHDRRLERLTDGAGPVQASTWAELRSRDAAYHFGPDRGYPLRGTGVRIPTLEEAALTFPELLLNLDLKGAGVARLLPPLLRRLGLEDRVLIASFLDHRIAVAKRLTGGRVATSAGSSEVAAALTAARAGRGLRTQADAFQVPVTHGRMRVIDAGFVAAAHAAGTQVHAWTVNDPDEMRRLLALGVDGIVTDRPDLLNEVVGQPR